MYSGQIWCWKPQNNDVFLGQNTLEKLVSLFLKFSNKRPKTCPASCWLGSGTSKNQHQMQNQFQRGITARKIVVLGNNFSITSFLGLVLIGEIDPGFIASCFYLDHMFCPRCRNRLGKITGVIHKDTSQIGCQIPHFCWTYAGWFCFINSR